MEEKKMQLQSKKAEESEVHIDVYKGDVWDPHRIYGSYLVVHVDPTGEMFVFPSDDHR